MPPPKLQRALPRVRQRVAVVLVLTVQSKTIRKGPAQPQAVATPLQTASLHRVPSPQINDHAARVLTKPPPVISELPCWPGPCKAELCRMRRARAPRSTWYDNVKELWGQCCKTRPMLRDNAAEQNTCANARERKTARTCGNIKYNTTNETDKNTNPHDATTQKTWDDETLLTARRGNTNSSKSNRTTYDHQRRNQTPEYRRRPISRLPISNADTRNGNCVDPGA